MPELRAEHIRTLRSLVDVMSRRLERARSVGKQDEIQERVRPIQARKADLAMLEGTPKV